MTKISLFVSMAIHFLVFNTESTSIDSKGIWQLCAIIYLWTIQSTDNVYVWLNSYKPLYHIEYSVTFQYSCPEVSISLNVVYPNLLRIFSIISKHGQSTSIRMNFNRHLYSSPFSSIKLSNPPPFSHLYTLPAPNHLHFPSHSSPSGRQCGSQPCGFKRVSSTW